MREEFLEVPRTARFHMLGTPGPALNDVWIVCHGFAQLAGRFLRRFAHIGSESRLVVAPEALNRFYIDTSPRPHGPDAVVGATWMTREDREHEIVDYVRYLDALNARLSLLGVPPEAPRTLLGFSQGVSTVARWVSLGAVRPARVVLWSGHLPIDIPDSSAQRWRGLRLTLVWGTGDASASSAAFEVDRAWIAATGAQAEWIQFAGGHELDKDTLATVAGSPQAPSSTG